MDLLVHQKLHLEGSVREALQQGSRDVALTMYQLNQFVLRKSILARP